MAARFVTSLAIAARSFPRRAPMISYAVPQLMSVSPFSNLPTGGLSEAELHGLRTIDRAAKSGGVSAIFTAIQGLEQSDLYSPVAVSRAMKSLFELDRPSASLRLFFDYQKDHGVPSAGMYIRAMEAAGNLGQNRRVAFLLEQMRSHGYQAGAGPMVALMEAHARNRAGVQAQELWAQIKEEGHDLTFKAYANYIRALVYSKLSHEALDVIEEARKDENIHLGATILSLGMQAALQIEDPDLALKFYDEILNNASAQESRTGRSAMLYLRAMGMKQDADEFMETFRNLRNKHRACYHEALRMLLDKDDLSKAMSVLEEMKTVGGALAVTPKVLNSLIAYYLSKDQVDEAFQVLDSMEEIDSRTANTIVAHFSAKEMFQEAVDAFDKLRAKDPHVGSSWSILRVCEALDQLGRASEIEAYVEGNRKSRGYPHLEPSVRSQLATFLKEKGLDHLAAEVYPNHNKRFNSK